MAQIRRLREFRASPSTEAQRGNGKPNGPGFDRGWRRSKNSGTAALLRLRCRLASGMPPEG